MLDKDYNDEPVFYCTSCLSLKIMNDDQDGDIPCYCDDCGSCDISEGHIEEVLKLRKNSKYFKIN